MDKNTRKLMDLIKNDECMALGALMAMHALQTNGDNKVTFNNQDSGFLFAIAKKDMEGLELDDRQKWYLRKAMPKYVNQLLKVGITLEKIKDLGFDGTKQEELNIIKIAERQKNSIIIKFKYPYGDERFKKTILKIKTLPGYKFVKKEQCWKCPVSVEAVKKLKEFKFNLCENLNNWYEDITSEKKLITNFSIPGLKKKLYQFQKEGVSFIKNNKGRALIVDEMGLGKTVQALGYAQLNKKLRPVIIVCPSSLKQNWANEIKAWMEKETIHIISGKKMYPIPHVDIYIINYDILSTWTPTLKALRAEIIILDEFHYIKTNGALRTKTTISLCKKIKRVIALSGTPIINRPIEFFNIIRIIHPGLFPNRWNFAKKYCDLKHNSWGWDFSGSSNILELHKILTKSIMIRRKKEDVLKELPPKTKSIIPIKIDNFKEYKKAENNIIDWIKEHEGEEKAKKAKKAEALTSLEKLKQLSINGKFKQCIKWINNFLESDQKLVIFAIHKKTINLLIKEFPKMTVKIDGSTPSNKRQTAVDKFQTDPKIKLFVGNIKSAGTGLTLNASSNVCFLEYPWEPGTLSQAEDRCHRIGQKKNVNIHYLVSQNTIEEDIMSLLKEKAIVVDQILDGKITKSTNIFNDLINILKNKREK